MRSPSERHIDAALSNISVAYRNKATGYAATQIMPVVRVGKQSDKYYEFGKENLTRSDSRRQDKTKSNRASYSLSEESYYCESYALHDYVTDKDRKNSDFGDPEMDTTEFLTDKILLDYEYSVASYLTNTSNLTNYVTLSGTSQFSDYTNSLPQTVFETGKVSVYANTFREANVALIPYAVAQKLALHPHVKDVLKYTDPATITRSGLPPVLWGLRVIEAGAGYNSANIGQTAVLAPIWGKNIIIAHVPDAPGLKTISMGYTFSWQDEGAEMISVSKWDEPSIGKGGVAIEPEMNFDKKITAVGAGYLITAAIA